MRLAIRTRNLTPELTTIELINNARINDKQFGLTLQTKQKCNHQLYYYITIRFISVTIANEREETQFVPFYN